MVDFYISWCPNIHKDEKALEYVKNSKLIKGIEGIYVDESLYKICEFGVNYSVHNPTFKGEFCDVKDEEFIFEFENHKKLHDGLKLSAPKVMAFHPPTVSDRFDTFTENLKFLQTKTDKKLMIEPRPYWIKSDFEGKKGFERSYMNLYLMDNFRAKITSVDFLEEYLSENGFGLLLDISHMRIAVLAMIKDGYYNGTVEEFFLDLAKRIGDKIYQIHINQAKSFEDIFLDSHTIINEDSQSVELLSLIIPYLKNLEFITMEITTGFEPMEHVLALEDRIELLKEKVALLRD